MKPILLRIGLRYLNQNPLQTGLLILSVAIGVAVIVAVDLANESASRSFQISAESIIGRATHRITGGPSGLDEDLYRRLRLELGLEKIAPVVEDYITARRLRDQWAATVVVVALEDDRGQCAPDEVAGLRPICRGTLQKLCR